MSYRNQLVVSAAYPSPSRAVTPKISAPHPPKMSEPTPAAITTHKQKANTAPLYPTGRGASS